MLLFISEIGVFNINKELNNWGAIRIEYLSPCPLGHLIRVESLYQHEEDRGYAVVISGNLLAKNNNKELVRLVSCSAAHLVIPVRFVYLGGCKVFNQHSELQTIVNEFTRPCVCWIMG